MQNLSQNSYEKRSKQINNSVWQPTRKIPSAKSHARLHMPDEKYIRLDLQERLGWILVQTRR